MSSVGGSDSEEKGVMQWLSDGAGSAVDGVGDWVDKSKARRAVFFGVVLPTFCILGLVVVTQGAFLTHGFSALHNPGIATISGVAGIGGAGAVSIAELFTTFMRDMSEKNKQRARKIRTIALPILCALALVVAPAIPLAHGGPVGGFATTTYGLIYGAGIIGFLFISANSINTMNHWKGNLPIVGRESISKRMENLKAARELAKEQKAQYDAENKELAQQFRS